MVVDSVLLVPSLLLLVAGVSLLTAFWRRQVGKFEDGSHLRLGDSGLWVGGRGNLGCLARPVTVPHLCARRVLSGAGNGGDGGSGWKHRSQVSPLRVSLAHCQAGPALWEKPSFMPASVM